MCLQLQQLVPAALQHMTAAQCLQHYTSTYCGAYAPLGKVGGRREGIPAGTGPGALPGPRSGLRGLGVGVWILPTTLPPPPPAPFHFSPASSPAAQESPCAGQTRPVQVLLTWGLPPRHGWADAAACVRLAQLALIGTRLVARP